MTNIFILPSKIYCDKFSNLTLNGIDIEFENRQIEKLKGIHEIARWGVSGDNAPGHMITQPIQEHDELIQEMFVDDAEMIALLERQETTTNKQDLARTQNR